MQAGLVKNIWVAHLHPTIFLRSYLFLTYKPLSRIALMHVWTFTCLYSRRRQGFFSLGFATHSRSRHFDCNPSGWALIPTFAPCLTDPSVNPPTKATPRAYGKIQTDQGTVVQWNESQKHPAQRIRFGLQSLEGTRAMLMRCPHPGSRGPSRGPEPGMLLPTRASRCPSFQSRFCKHWG